MTVGSNRFLALSAQDRRDVFAATASRLDTLPSYVEKDFWVCLVLEILFLGRPEGHPKLLFKGGTSLSKAFGLIRRFSEDIDLVVYRDALGFDADRDPTQASGLSNKIRRVLFDELQAACGNYVVEELSAALAPLVGAGCRPCLDDGDATNQTLLIEYATLYPSRDIDYVVPRVKIEAGARSALVPNRTCKVTPYVADELTDWSFDVEGITVISPQRTYLEKLLILHGAYCGYRDAERLPTDKDRVSRHYYDVAMITATETGRSALSDVGLLDAVRRHNLIAFRQAWKRFEEAVPGSVRLVPQPEPRAVIEQDYQAMQGMILGEAPEFGWIMDHVRRAEIAINRA